MKTALNNRLMGMVAFIAASFPFSAQAAIEVHYEPDGIECHRMLAGQHIEAGEVCLEVQGDFMTVSYQTKDGWQLIEAHLWAGTDLSQLPAGNQGNPQIGNFPYKSGDISGATNYAFHVPLKSFGDAELCDARAYLAAHASLRKPNGDSYQQETGWLEGKQINGGSWAMYGSALFTCTEEPPPVPDPAEEGCETAFAFGDRNGDLVLDRDKGDLELDDFLKTKRWGWQLAVQKDDSFTVPIYAAAGRNDISKGTLVGELDVTYKKDMEVDVSYRMLPGFFLDETHLYVGGRYIPKAAPGTYGNAHKLDGAESDSYTVKLKTNANPVYVVAHAVVRSEMLGGECKE